MQKLKRAFAVVCFALLFFSCGAVLRYVLVQDGSSYTRVMMHELYTQEENIDVLFVGSSHCYRTMDTAIADEIFGAETFNVGTSAQELDGSFALIKEANKKNDIKQVYLEMYYHIAQMPAYEERGDLVSTYIIADYMRPSLNKLAYLLRASSMKHYSNSFVPARRNWEKLFESGYVQEVLRGKSAAWYKDYTYPFSEVERYAGKGYVAVELQGEGFSSEHFEPFDADAVSQDYIDSLMDIIDYCKKHDIELTLFSTPMPPMRLADMGNYDTYIAFINELIAETGVNYYDFNLCRQEYLPLDATHFADTDHLNRKGAELFTTMFSEFFTGKITEKDLFFDTYGQKLKTEEQQVYGVIAEQGEGNTVSLSAVTNADREDISYTVLWTPASGGQTTLLERSANAVVELPEGQDGPLQVLVYIGETQAYEVTVAKPQTPGSE